MIRDVTQEVVFGNNDDECLPIVECVCGTRFDAWTFVISIYRDEAKACPNCGRRLYFELGIRVYEVAGN